MSDDRTTTDESEGSDLPQILARVRLGDEDAARELLGRYESKVRLVVRRQLPRLLRSRFDSMDFLQSVWRSFFHRMRVNPSDLDDPENLVAFLARAAKNKVIDEYRRASSRKHDVRREEPLGPPGACQDFPGPSDTPSDVATAREAFVRLQELLPEGRRVMLELKAEGLSTREIGERLGVSDRTVRRVIEDLRRRAEIGGESEGEAGGAP